MASGASIDSSITLKDIAPSSDRRIVTASSEGKNGGDTNYTAILVTLALEASWLVGSFFLARWAMKSIIQSSNPALDKDKNLERRCQLIARFAQGNPEVAQRLMNNNEYEDALLAEVINPDEIDVTLEEVGGLESQKKLLREWVIYPIRTPHLFTGVVRPPKGILLYGPPGTGKTMLAKALAKESGTNFLAIRMSSVLNKYVGETQKLARAVFSLAYKLEPCIIFVDEVDSMLRTRSDDDHQVTADLKTEFMTMWDGLTTENNKRVTVLAASNRPWDIDPAIQRRLTRAVHTDLPTRAQREKIFRVILSKQAVDPAMSFAKLAEITEGYSGSDIKDLCSIAAMIPVREAIATMEAQTHSQPKTHTQAALNASSPATPTANTASTPSTSASVPPTTQQTTSIQQPSSSTSTTTPTPTPAPAPTITARPVQFSDFTDALREYNPTSAQSDRYLSSYMQSQQQRQENIFRMSGLNPSTSGSGSAVFGMKGTANGFGNVNENGDDDDESSEVSE
eukprot:TRINITY_DN14860_c0_g1::TRINITY_DN14860_c0_g1_i1::g.16178::m.16178 TRINITY_DN14860_c0_g1::TRINITY_DN14860_c0_g1_i1::g.16178  ORF type:complete len:538 (+),score=130.43,sp/Q7ZZ25/ATD1A_DANRE/41.67/1e-77,AAA/PF00004.24/9.6e-38,RuvB_N/PF05496.7/18,RuvB_N/PF05496.7/3.8e-05,AAA_5/PF07728.9/1.4e-05,DUF815/PF05673.8/3.4e-06,AAA_16/PF13191.1/0.00027,AAA_22/PF13401.1/0.00087,AAA_17/PF13207.1/4.2e+03,AAA_17/PF13207.1/0.00014,AAA_14/PF13173.1/9.6e-05,AAA_25/PF13481.1/0.004,AAA_25/PF13481.1/45,AAA_11/PF13086